MQGHIEKRGRKYFIIWGNITVGPFDRLFHAEHHKLECDRGVTKIGRFSIARAIKWKQGGKP